MRLPFLFLEVKLYAATKAIDWNEIIYILVGALIGFFASIIVMLVERVLDKKGKLNIFYRRTSQRWIKGSGWGFDSYNDDELYFTLPIIFELQNTSNTTRVIRDVSLLLYYGKDYIGKMHQVEGMHVQTRNGTKITKEENYEFGAEKGSYSFVMPPRSIQRQECEYQFMIDITEKDNKKFDTVIAQYYDERNIPHTFKMMEITNCWERHHYKTDEDWYILKEKVRIRRNR